MALEGQAQWRGGTYGQQAEGHGPHKLEERNGLGCHCSRCVLGEYFEMMNSCCLWMLGGRKKMEFREERERGPVTADGYGMTGDVLA